jgi:aerobic-type carbon monoxide dehydrogenase small subunit (CoxS/CutS family)
MDLPPPPPPRVAREIPLGTRNDVYDGSYETAMDGPVEPREGGSKVRLTVNGRAVAVARSPDRSLLELLRFDLGLTGTKYGCGEGECGACSVLVDGAPARSCQVRLEELEGSDVRTIEGLAAGGVLNPVQRAFVELGAFQCGFCTPGMVVRATALLERSPAPSEAEIRASMAENICRCGGYPRIERAIERAAELARESAGEGA